MSYNTLVFLISQVYMSVFKVHDYYKQAFTSNINFFCQNVLKIKLPCSETMEWRENHYLNDHFDVNINQYHELSCSKY